MRFSVVSDETVGARNGTLPNFPLTTLPKKLFKKLRRSRRRGHPIVAMTNTSRGPDNSAAHNEYLLKPSDGKACTQSDVEKTTKRVRDCRVRKHRAVQRLVARESVRTTSFLDFEPEYQGTPPRFVGGPVTTVAIMRVEIVTPLRSGEHGCVIFQVLQLSLWSSSTDEMLATISMSLSTARPVPGRIAVSVRLGKS